MLPPERLRNSTLKRITQHGEQAVPVFDKIREVFKDEIERAMQADSRGEGRREQLITNFSTLTTG